MCPFRDLRASWATGTLGPHSQEENRPEGGIPGGQEGSPRVEGGRNWFAELNNGKLLRSFNPNRPEGGGP